MKYSEGKKSEFDGIDTFFQNYPTQKDARQHPKYRKFKDTLMGWGLTEEQAFSSWNLLIQGIYEQRRLNQLAEGITAANVDVNNLHQYCCSDIEYETVCREMFVSLDAPKQLIFFQNVIKASNHYYVLFAQKLSNFLSTGESDLSLWSGGYDLSELSHKMKHCPLEKTALGELLDNLPITTNWKEEAALWNIISRTFVKSYRGRNVHVYIRTIDKESVLLRQEIPMIEKREGVNIHWHVFFSNGTHFAKVGYERKDGVMSPKAINPDEFKNGFDKKIAFELLTTMLGNALYDSNKQAYNQVLRKELPEYRAPFAYYD